MGRKKQQTLHPASVRRYLQEVKEELARVDEQRSAQIALLRGYEAWLRVYDPPITPARDAATAPGQADSKPATCAKSQTDQNRPDA